MQSDKVSKELDRNLLVLTLFQKYSISNLAILLFSITNGFYINLGSSENIYGCKIKHRNYRKYNQT